MKRTSRIIRSMDGPIRVLGHLMEELRDELDKTAKELQEEMLFADKPQTSTLKPHPSNLKRVTGGGKGFCI